MVLAQPVRQPDAAPYVLSVLGADRGVGVERVAVAVQAGDADAGALEQSEEVVPGGIGGQDVVKGGDVHRRQEAARVELDAGEAEPGNDLDRLRQAAVVQDRVVDTELHQATALRCEAVSRWVATATDAPPLAADSETAASTSMLCTPSSNDAHRGSESASSMPATSSRNARA